jgi:hypothetical protein
MVGVPRFFGGLQEFQSRLRKRAVPFSRIAFLTAGHEIFPERFPSPGFRNHMVQGQIRCMESATAILAGILVPNQDIFLGGRFFPHPGNLDVVEQADDRWDADFTRRSMKIVRSCLLTHGHTLQDQHNGPPGHTDVDRFIGCVQDKYTGVHFPYLNVREEVFSFL